MSRDLLITRIIPAPRAIVWRCWSEPELLMRWFCPLPWRVTKAEMDLRAGGRSNIRMEGPEGQVHDNAGTYLEVVSGRSIIFTDAMTEGFIPSKGEPFMVGHVTLTDAPDGQTQMDWGARHWSDAARQKHEAMGFHEGWSAAAAQLADLARELATTSGKAG
jgi:uncharacterized protein YndB with AHSA1/START domain